MVSKKTLLLAGLVVLLVAAAAAVSYMLWKCSNMEIPGDVEEPFQSGGKLTKVEYFALPGCPHCEAFNPVWQAVETRIEGSDAASSLSLHKWDVKTEEGRAAAKEAGVTAFPHVQKTTPDGSVEVFNGKRTEESLFDFCQN